MFYPRAISTALFQLLDTRSSTCRYLPAAPDCDAALSTNRELDLQHEG